MKKLLLVSAAVVAVSLTSCKKDTCKYTESGIDVSITCETAYGHKCSKSELTQFQADCKAFGGTVKTK